MTQLRVYSEFQRVDPFGQILAADRAETPREILSPAVVRNAFVSFHVAVTAPKRTMYFLAVQSNPADAFRWTIQEEKFIRQGDLWTGDTLEQVRPPYFGVIPDPKANIPGQTTRVYLVDVWVPPTIPAGTVRFEVLLKTVHWQVWPMEVRVLGATVPELKKTGRPVPLPSLDLPADTAAWASLEAYMDDSGDSGAGPPMNVRAIIRRNAAQDMALAQQLPDRRVVVQEVARVMKQPRQTAGAEWYLKVRDFIYRAATRPAAR